MSNLELNKIEEWSKFEILFEDDEYLIIKKPYDVHLDGDHEITIENLIHKHGKFEKQSNKAGIRPRWVHQLDYATSGLLCVALTKKAASNATYQFEKRKVSKKYSALLFGKVLPQNEENTIYINEPIGKDKEHSFKMKIESLENGGKAASTELKILSYQIYNGQEVTHVLLTPKTGRRHQLRLHTKFIGHPIVGDTTYCGDSTSVRMFLHSMKLKIPMKDRILNFKTEDPFLFD